MTTSPHLIRALVVAVERAGIPRGRFLDAAGLDEERLTDDALRFGAADFGRLQELALDMSGDQALGLHLAEHASAAAFDLLGLVVSHAGTLREAISAISQFGSLVFSDFALALTERVDSASLEYRFGRISPRADRMHAEFAMAGLVRLVRDFVSYQAEFDAVRFEHAAPAHRAEYARFFGGKESFGRPATGLQFPRAWLDAPQLHRNDRLAALLRAEAHRTLGNADGMEPYSSRVRRYLRAHPSWRIPTMEDAARHLGTSVRSLRRRLTEEGVSYRELVNTALQDTASELLRDPRLSVSEAARAAGYSEATAFHRAFKRWTGVTPRQFRRLPH